MATRSRGSQFEMEVFGVSADWEGIPVYVSFDEAIDIAISKQPNWDPLHPSTVLGKDILRTIRMALYKALDSYSISFKRYITSRTGLYVSIGTSADFWHQTDAIICCDLGSVSPIVTIDLKLSDYGDEIRDNHFIITRAHFEQVASNGQRRIEIVAGLIADQLIEQLVNLAVLNRNSKVS